MRKKSRVVVLLMVTSLLFGATGVFAGSQLEKITAYINHDIAFTVDDQSWQPTDKEGNALGPIVYKGTSYLPARSVAEAVGATINWDPASYTIHIKSPVELEDPNAGIPYQDTEDYVPVNAEALAEETPEAANDLVDLGIAGINEVYEESSSSVQEETNFSMFSQEYAEELDGQNNQASIDGNDAVELKNFKLVEIQTYAEKHTATLTYTATKVETADGKTTSTTVFYTVELISEKGYVVINSIEAH